MKLHIVGTGSAVPFNSPFVDAFVVENATLKEGEMKWKQGKQMLRN